jgi:hypothetical protein
MACHYSKVTHTRSLTKGKSSFNACIMEYQFIHTLTKIYLDLSSYSYLCMNTIGECSNSSSTKRHTAWGRFRVKNLLLVHNLLALSTRNFGEERSCWWETNEREKRSLMPTTWDLSTCQLMQISFSVPLRFYSHTHTPSRRNHHQQQ